MYAFVASAAPMIDLARSLPPFRNPHRQPSGCRFAWEVKAARAGSRECPFEFPQTDDQGQNRPGAHSLLEPCLDERSKPGLGKKLEAHPQKHRHKWDPGHGKGPKTQEHAKLKERVRRRP